MPDRILHIVPALFGPDGIVGGAERYAYELARHMAETHPTTLLTFGENACERQSGNLRVRVAGPPWYVRGQRGNPLSRSLIAEILGASIVHCHQQHILASTVAAVTARATWRRVFVSELGGGGWDLSNYISTDRCFNGHLHLSEYSRRVSGHNGKPWARVVYGGVDTGKFQPGPPSSSESPVLYVGRILPHKGINYLVDALPGNMRLQIVGRVYDERFAADLKRRADGKQVQFFHDFTDEQLVNAYRRCLCLVLPSVYCDVYGARTEVPELLGQTLLEGMACGRPAICTDVASMPEVVREGVTGFVVPPNDAAVLHRKLLWLHDNAAIASRMGEAARAHVLERFTWRAVVERCLRAYSGQN